VELSDGRIGYSLKKSWRDGTTAVVMTKQVLMERLCALVPKPRKHLVTYHGVSAPASGLRSGWTLFAGSILLDMTVFHRPTR
jgi:hypothetical protein